MKLRIRALGMAFGIVWGLGIFLITLWDVWLGFGLTLSHLRHIYLGYSVSYPGAIVGLIWGFVDGFICGVLIAWLYNRFHKAFYKSEATA